MFNLIGLDVVLEVGHAMYASAYMSECEERDVTIPKTEDDVPKLSDHDILPIMAYYIGRVDQAWGYSVGLVFHHMFSTSSSTTMQLDRHDRVQALFHLLMGCIGHGLSIADDYGDLLDRAGEVLGGYKPIVFSPTPFQTEGTEWSELASNQMDGLYGEFPPNC